MCPDFSGGRNGGPRNLCEALRGKIRCNTVGLLINGEGGAKEEWVLFVLCLEMLK